MELKNFCETCGRELVEGHNVKKNYHIPLCEDCREIVNAYEINKEKIVKIMKARAIREKENSYD
jgi:hypothetical protein